MELEFVVTRRLVRRRMPRIRFFSIGSYLCSALPSDPASRRRPCALPGLHLHRAVQGAPSFKLPGQLPKFHNPDKTAEAVSDPPELDYRRQPELPPICGAPNLLDSLRVVCGASWVRQASFGKTDSGNPVEWKQ